MSLVDSRKKSVSVSQADRILLDITLQNCEAAPQPRPRLGKNGRVYSTKKDSKADVFKAEVRVRARSYRGRQAPHIGPVELQLTLVFGGPKGATKWTWETRQSKGDFDNIEKAVADALGGVALSNDSHIAKNQTEKIQGPHGTKPYVRIRLLELQDPPTA